MRLIQKDHTPAEVTMTLDKTVVWESRPTEAGTVYVSPVCPPGVAEMVVEMSQPDSLEFAAAHRVNSGGYADVVEVEGVAYKRARKTYSEGEMGISALRAHAALEAGLGKTHTLHGNRLWSPSGTPFEMVSPTYYAGFVPNRKMVLGTAAARQLWAMSFEPGERPSDDPMGLPSSSDRRALLHDAVRESGLDPRLVNFDCKRNNYRVRESATAREVGGRTVYELVKLDLMTIMDTRSMYEAA